MPRLNQCDNVIELMEASTEWTGFIWMRDFISRRSPVFASVLTPQLDDVCQTQAFSCFRSPCGCCCGSCSDAMFISSQQN